jgi:hypothetical protein
MSCIALSIATEGSASPFWRGPTALRSCTVPRDFVFRHRHPHFSTLLSSGTARENQAAPGGTAGFCFPGLLPQSQCGSPSHKAALGAWEQPSLASVPAECPE